MSTRRRVEDTGFYEAYAAFSRTVRAWFIAFGVGVPVLFLSNRDIWSTLKATAAARVALTMFLVGAAIQVLVALLYRSAMWYLYVGELGSLPKKKWQYKAANWVSDQHWPEILADLATLALFGVATLRMLTVLWT